MRFWRVTWAIVFASVTLGCRGQGVDRVRPQLVMPDPQVDFGSVPVLNERTLEIQLLNVGRAALHVSSVSLEQPEEVFRLTRVPEAVESGVTQAIEVAFVPPREGSFGASVSFETDDEDHPVETVALVGSGSTRAAVEVEPSAIDFGRVGECSSSLRQLAIRSSGTAALVLKAIALEEGTSNAFSFVGSTRTPATIPAPRSDDVAQEIQLTVKAAPPALASGVLHGAILLKTTDPDRQDLRIPLVAAVNQAPVANIGLVGNAALGQTLTLDATGSEDPDGDSPLTYAWTLRSKPLGSTSAIAEPTAVKTSVRLDANLTGAYEFQLTVSDAQGVPSCQPALSSVVAAPTQKLLVELFWDNTGTDLDLHMLSWTNAKLFSIPDDCFYQNRTPDWGAPGGENNPELVRDSLVGYGPEVFGYASPIESTYRVAVVFENELLSAMPKTKATVRITVLGVLKAERSKSLEKKGEVWEVADIHWPSGEVTPLP